MRHQRGGTFLGFILGVLVGLGAALVVAVYVTKVPVPFVNKSQSRTPEQDAAESRKNKDWDPNAPLYGKNPAARAPAASGATPETAAVPEPAQGADKSAAKAGAAKTDPKADPKGDAKVDGKTDPKAAAGKPDARPASADPLGDLARAKSGTAEPVTYYVQVGAYRQPDEAETQRAKLTMMGVEAKVSEREQSGRMVYRVRVGPFEQRDEAEKTRDKLDGAGLETTLVKVQR